MKKSELWLRVAAYALIGLSFAPLNMDKTLKGALLVGAMVLMATAAWVTISRRRKEAKNESNN